MINNNELMNLQELVIDLAKIVKDQNKIIEMILTKIGLEITEEDLK